MAATMTPRRLARILKIQEDRVAVSKTDRKNRLPTISSAEVDTIFDQLRLDSTQMERAA